ncbi:unnamed protein product, partial [Rotaria sp. Silwood1]
MKLNFKKFVVTLAEDTEKFSKSSSILVTGERSLSGSTMKPVKLDLSNIKSWNSDPES